MGKIKYQIIALLLACALVTYAGSVVLADDLLAPTIDNKLPTENASSVAVDTSIQFDIWDTESGISLNSLILKINDIDMTTDVVSSGSTASYNFTYTPAADFDYGKTVSVDIYIEDISGIKI